MALTARNIVRMPAPALRGAASININAKWLDSVRFVATSGTLATIDAGQVVDGVTVVAGDSFLYQPVAAGVATPGATNGIYVAGADGVAPVRRGDADAGDELLNATVAVRSGTVGAGQAWICTNATAPNVGTDTITFRLIQTNTQTSTTTLAASADFATYSGGADVVTTAGYTTYPDAGGMTWKRGTTTMPSTLTYFRKSDFGGVWYEAVSKRTIAAESVGIFGQAGVDVGANINDVLDWLGTHGGGRLILPPGETYSSVNLLIDRNGVQLQGTATGSTASGATDGSILKLANGRTFFIGGDKATGGLDRYMIKISDLAITQADTPAVPSTYFFTSRAVRGLKFADIQGLGVYGFQRAGNVAHADNLSRVMFYNNIEVQLYPTAHEHGIRGDNMGISWMTNCFFSGASSGATILPGSSFMTIPSTGLNNPDGSNFVNVMTSYFDRGIDVSLGTGVFLISNSWFDGCKTAGIRLAPATGQAVNGFRVTNCHIAGIDVTSAPVGSTAVGVVISELSGGGIGLTEISDCHIKNFGRNAVRIEGPVNTVTVTDNQMLGNAITPVSVGSNVGTDPHIYLGATVGQGVIVTGNRIYAGNSSVNATYGIEIDTTSSDLTVTHNQIMDAVTTIKNPNRGSAKTRRVYNNSGQVFEGQVILVGPWSISDLAASTPAGTRVQIAALPGVNDALIPRRGRVLTIAARANANLGAGAVANSVTFNLFINGATPVPPRPLLVAQNAGPSIAEAFGENLDGVEFDALDQLGIAVQTTAAYGPATLDWSVFLQVVYD